MRAETSMLARDHVAYVGSSKQNAAELRQYETIYDHFYFYLTKVRGLLPDTARGIVEDFEADLQRQPDSSDDD